MHDITLEENHFQGFLNLFTHYMCSRCEGCPPHHTEQDNTDGSGRHSHNGEILNYWRGAPPTSQRVLSAYAYYSRHSAPSNIQRGLARAYNTPATKGLPDQPYAQAARTLLDHPHSTYLRHGIELPERSQYAQGRVYPPPDSRHSIGEQTTGKLRQQNRYAVDMDTPPFIGCSVHRGDRETQQPWADVAGYINIGTFRKHGGELHNPRDRDHLYASGSINAEQWIYVYNDIPNTQDQHHRRSALAQLQNSGLPAIHHSTVHKLWKLRTLLHNYSQAWSALVP